MSQVNKLDSVSVVRRLSSLHNKMIREGLTPEETKEKRELFDIYHMDEVAFMNALLKRLDKAERRHMTKYVKNHTWQIMFDKDSDRKETYKRYVSGYPNFTAAMPHEEAVRVVDSSFFQRTVDHLLSFAKDEPDGHGSYVADEFMTEEILQARKFLDDAGIEWRDKTLKGR